MALHAETNSFSHKLDQLSDGFKLASANAVYSQPQFAESFSSTSVDLSADHTRRPLKAGINVPALAFFHPDTEDVDVETVAKHAVRLAQAGISSITTQGSNGEAVHLTHSERKLITSTTRKALDDAGFHHVPVIVGCGSQSTREAIELCHEAHAAGGDYALVLPPSYYKASYTQQSFIDYFEDLASASPIPILIYNYPGAVAGVDLDSETLIHLAKHPNIVGCKLTCSNTGKLNRVASATRAATPSDPGSGFMCMGGSADFTLPTMIAGGSGIVTGLGNVAPKACVKVFDLWVAGKLEEAQKVQAVVARGDWAAIAGGIVGTKSGLETYFGYGGFARRPLPKPSKQDVAKYAENFREVVELEQSL
jgi:dihydrodipicolinate synthase/N-acetylneuraminate lyase